jgi:hypothetical protein
MRAMLGYNIVAMYYDAAVSGADHVDTRPGWRDMMASMQGSRDHDDHSGDGQPLGL